MVKQISLKKNILDVIRTNPNVDFYRDEKIQTIMVPNYNYIKDFKKII